MHGFQSNGRIDTDENRDERKIDKDADYDDCRDTVERPAVQARGYEADYQKRQSALEARVAR